MGITEINGADKMAALTAQDWLISVLSGDTTLTSLGVTGVYAGGAPIKATYPLVEVGFVYGEPLTNNGNQIIWFDEIYDVKCIDNRESWNRVISIADRILALLHNKTDQVQGSGVMVGCSMINKIQFSEMDELKNYVHLGWSFRVYTK